MSTLGRLQAKNLVTVHARNHRAVEERKEKLLHSERESRVLINQKRQHLLGRIAEHGVS
jgi:hypothetical protein